MEREQEELTRTARAQACGAAQSRQRTEELRVRELVGADTQAFARAWPSPLGGTGNHFKVRNRGGLGTECRFLFFILTREYNLIAFREGEGGR